MERLTERNADGSVKYAKGCYSGCEYLTCSMEEGYQCNHQCEADIVCKLADYEDAEEQGLLLRLPCPIGTTVYNITWWDIVQEKVKVNGKTFYRETHKHKVSKSTFSFMDIKDFGKTVFITKEEAEQALKQMGE